MSVSMYKFVGELHGRRLIKVLGFFVPLSWFIFCGVAQSQTSAPQRPRILGIAHVALNENDPQRAKAFYESYLGFTQPYTLKRPDGTPWISYVKINDKQYLELFENTRGVQGQFNHYALYTDDLYAMQQYLSAWHIRLEEPIRTTRTGDALLSVRDPAGNLIEIVQYQSGSWSDGARGRFLPATRISDHMTHIGLVFRNPVPVIRFYRDIFGFKTVSAASSDMRRASFAMRVPDGTDYVEFLSGRPATSGHTPLPTDFICFGTPDAQRASAVLQSRRRGHPEWKGSVLSAGHIILSDPSGYEIQVGESHPDVRTR